MDEQRNSAAEALVGDVGEFALIERLTRIVGRSAAVVGIGDDAAVLDIGGPDYLLATVDATVDGVHFRLDRHPARSVGQRPIAVNISDIAAMGGQPQFALTSIALPPTAPVHFVEELYRGMREMAARYSTSIVGGNVTGIDGPLVLDVVLLGRVPRDEVVTRAGARRGDVLAVTGTLGTRAAIWRAETAGVDLGDLGPWAEASYVPEPRVQAARALASAHLLHAMLDLSDGLAGDIRHLCSAGGVGAVIDECSLPVAEEVRTIAGMLGRDAAEIALTGGEDYELLCALPAEALSAAQAAVGDTRLTPIGRITEAAEGITVIRSDGHREALVQRSWEHF